MTSPRPFFSTLMKQATSSFTLERTARCRAWAVDVDCPRLSNIGQVYHHYGADGGDAVLGSIGTMIFLPGLDQRTAEYASKRIGQATVWQATSVDVKEGTKFDSERTTEVGRSLLDAAEVRRMVKHQQAIAIIGNAPPVRFSYPPQARLTNAPLSQREKTWIKPPSPAKKVEATVETKVEAPAASLIVTDNRPAFSFAANPTFPPEYNPAQLTPAVDPSIHDAPEPKNAPKENDTRFRNKHTLEQMAADVRYYPLDRGGRTRQLWLVHLHGDVMPSATSRNRRLKSQPKICVPITPTPSNSPTISPKSISVSGIRLRRRIMGRADARRARRITITAIPK
ncbi:MAG: TraM recognition domain-containing protein [Blastocatellia bacterium]